MCNDGRFRASGAGVFSYSTGSKISGVVRAGRSAGARGCVRLFKVNEMGLKSQIQVDLNFTPGLKSA